MREERQARSRRRRLASRVSVFATAAVIGGVFGSWASADGIPETNTLYYSGILEEGSALVDGTRNVVIRLFDDATTGTERCVTNASGVGFDAGRFRVPLVEACVNAVRDEPDLWVEVQIGGDAPFARAKLGAVPYAVEAERAQDAVRAEIAESAAVASGAAGTLALRITNLEEREIQCVTVSAGDRYQSYWGTECPAGYTVTGGSCYSRTGSVGAVDCLPEGNGWACRSSNGHCNSVHSRCCRVD